jgi:hypothetical protein
MSAVWWQVAKTERTGFYSSLRERTEDRVIGQVESADTDRR